MRPETKKGLFANGKSSKPGIISLLQSTKATSKISKLLSGAQANERPEGLFFSIELRKPSNEGVTRSGLERSMETEILPTTITQPTR